jgi:glucosamine-6-phosphate isomerase
MKTIKTENYDSLSRETATLIADFIRENPNSLLCLAAGDTPLGTFRELIKMQSNGIVNLSSVYYAGLDEWIGLGPNDKGSCYQVMFENFYLPAKIPQQRIHVFNGLGDPVCECDLMAKWLTEKGEIGLSMLGIGMNGHIGFNEPNAPEIDVAGIVPLDDVTKSVSIKYFDMERHVTTGITIGLPVLRKAQKVLVIASGEKKAQIVRNAFFEKPNPNIPASMLLDHPDLTLLIDF